jgi:hypothetical protein
MIRTDAKGYRLHSAVGVFFLPHTDHTVVATSAGLASTQAPARTSPTAPGPLNFITKNR